MLEFLVLLGQMSWQVGQACKILQPCSSGALSGCAFLLHPGAFAEGAPAAESPEEEMDQSDASSISVVSDFQALRWGGRALDLQNICNWRACWTPAWTLQHMFCHSSCPTIGWSFW